MKMSGEIDGEMGWEKRRESRVSAGRLGRVCDGRRRWRKSVNFSRVSSYRSVNELSISQLLKHRYLNAARLQSIIDDDSTAG